MAMETDKLAKMIELDMLSPAMLTYVLLNYAQEDRAGVETLLLATKPHNLEAVYDILMMYPQTEVGWTILPASRTPFRHSNLDRHEVADVEHRQYQEDRPHIEYLRGKTRPS